MDKAQSTAAPAKTADAQPQDKPQAGKPETAKKDPKQRRWSLGREIAYITFGCIGTLLGAVFFLASIGFLVGSRYLEGIINDIGSTNFTEQMERIDHYSSFFDAMRENGYRVRREDPEIDKGVIYYLWQAIPPGSDEARVFRWKHDLESNEVEPLNNPALLMDLKLGYLKEQDAIGWNFDDPSQHYDPGDNLVQAMVNNDFSMINPADLADRGSGEAAPPQGPVGAPLINPSEGSHRGGDEEEKADGDNAGGEEKTGEAQPVDPGTSPPPSEETTPPADPGPGQNDDPGGDVIDVH